MLITALSSVGLLLLTVMLGVGIYLTIRAFNSYHNYKTAFGEFHVYSIPSIHQVRRITKMKELEMKCIILLISDVVLLVVIACFYFVQ